MAHHRGFRRVVTEKAIDAVARKARTRIMARFALFGEGYINARELRSAIFHDIGDCVRIKSRLEPR